MNIEPVKRSTKASKIESREGELFYNGVPVSAMLAYPIQVVLKLTGLGRTTLWEEIQLGRIKMSPKKLISKSELGRYLANGKTS